MGEEALHLLIVTSKDEDDLTFEILDLGKQVVKHGRAARVVSGCQLVSLVYEDDAAAMGKDPVDHGLAFLGPIAGHRRSRRFHEASSGYDTNFGEKSPVKTRHGCLA